MFLFQFCLKLLACPISNGIEWSCCITSLYHCTVDTNQWSKHNDERERREIDKILYMCCCLVSLCLFNLWNGIIIDIFDVNKMDRKAVKSSRFDPLIYLLSNKIRLHFFFGPMKNPQNHPIRCGGIIRRFLPFRFLCGMCCQCLCWVCFIIYLNYTMSPIYFTDSCENKFRLIFEFVSDFFSFIHIQTWVFLFNNIKK